MHPRRLLRNLFLAGTLVLPAEALAERVVLSPLIPVRGVNADQVRDLYGLFTAELEFNPSVDELIELSPRPPALTAACLDSSRCLRTLVSDAGGDTMVTGTVEGLGPDYILDLLYFSVAEGRTVRRKTWTVPQDAGAMVDRITPILVELFTGTSPQQARADSTMAGVDFGEEDDFAFAPAAPVAAAPPPEPAVREVNRPIAPPPQPPPPRQPPPAQDDLFSVGDVSFGPEDITFGDEPVTYPAEQPPPPPRYDPYDDPLEDEPVRDPYYDDRRDLDAPDDRRTARTPPSSSTRSSTRKASPEGYEYKRAYLTVRGGMSRYGLFTFGNVGAEIMVRAVSGLTLGAGIQVNIVRRQIDTAGTVATNFIFPANVGLLYRFKDGRFQPYAGADVLFAQLLRQQTETGPRSYFTFGARVRGGFDYYITPNFGINLDIGLGFLSGEQWPLVDVRQPQIGFYPQGTAGLVFAF